MYYVIQENLYREFHFNTLIKHLERYNLGYEIVKFIPFSDEIEVKTDRKDIWFFGSNNGSVIAKKYDWVPGSMFNEKHDYAAYAPYYQDNLLNHGDAWLQKLEDPIPDELGDEFFARPSADTKSFSGQIFSRAEWRKWQLDLEDSNLKQSLSNETMVVLAKPKVIQQEIRCWIIDGEPVSMSQYKIGRRVNYLNMDHNEEAYIFSKKMAKLFSPARAFVMDICLHEDEYKIVELGCMNCCGFYDIDMSKVIQSLETTFNTENQ